MEIGFIGLGNMGFPLPLASLIHDHFVEALALGRGDLDWSALSSVIRDAAGLSASPAQA